ncbi:hypothetical protein TrLO_g3557 [Triparma laevis f. longispina]|uniref:Uncharacterized protein n=1 Tax=Triparma laevis f. longispina TaxID=1714387 RepID=A0A9W7DQ29_9STRA|nr:hypothetical protein TrLO_g3557 [Triparma laevis f. longispina]
MASSVRYIIPLGLRCTTAEAFKKHSLRRFALPFDWLFLSPSVIVDILSTNFTTLLDPSHYTKVGMSGTHPKVKHAKYTQMVPGAECTFIHHDPTSSDGSAYFDRTVSRFNTILEAADRKLFTLVCIDPSQWDLEGVKNIFSTLKTLTNNFVFIVVNLVVKSGSSGSSLSFHDQSNDCELVIYNQQCIGMNTGQHFTNPVDQDHLTTLLMFPPSTNNSIRDPYKFNLKSITL